MLIFCIIAPSECGSPLAANSSISASVPTRAHRSHSAGEQGMDPAASVYSEGAEKENRVRCQKNLF